MKIKFIFALITSILSIKAMAAEPEASGPQKRVLIIIGYADKSDSNISQVFSDPLTLLAKPHFNDLSEYLESSIEQEIEKRNFNQIEQTDAQFPWKQFESSDQLTQITLINSNVVCPGESLSGENRRYRDCDLQIQNSTQILDFLNQNSLLLYDELIYVGHARWGFGLGVGPFVWGVRPDQGRDDRGYTESFTYSLGGPNSLKMPGHLPDGSLGKLKKIVLAACESLEHYNFLKNRVELVGTGKFTTWVEVLGIALKEIDSL